MLHTTIVALILMLQNAPAPAPAPAEVTGQLTVSGGAPAGAVRVAIIQAPPPTIRPADGQNYYATVAPASIAVTDAQGRFRLGRIPPGRYYIVAGIVGHATYYPGTTDIDAATVLTIEAASRHERIDFPMLTALGSRVTGRITPPPPSNEPERAVVSGVELGEILEAAVEEDGTFEFGRVPAGEYLLNFFPPPPGMASIPFTVGAQDLPPLAATRPPVQTVTGRIVVDRGPLPPALLGFVSGKEYVSGTIHPDLTFSAKLHSARHRVDIGGLPVGYALRSVRAGGRDITQAFDVTNSDVKDVVITVSAPEVLGRLTGRVMATPLPQQVEVSGPIVGTVRTAVSGDGMFEFSALPPGLYRIAVPGRPELSAEAVLTLEAPARVQLGR